MTQHQLAHRGNSLTASNFVIQTQMNQGYSVQLRNTKSVAA